jgi:hypothetical protein
MPLVTPRPSSKVNILPNDIGALPGRFPGSRLVVGGQWAKLPVAYIVAAVRVRLSKEGVCGLIEEEIPAPVGNALNHNLIMDLLATGTIVRSHLSLLGEHDPA